VVEHLLCKHKALISNPVAPKKKKKERKKEVRHRKTKMACSHF
jgi:hypothetical protein